MDESTENGAELAVLDEVLGLVGGMGLGGVGPVLGGPELVAVVVLVGLDLAGLEHVVVVVHSGLPISVRP